MRNLHVKFLVWLAAILAMPSANATWGTERSTRVINDQRTGPENYHQVYGAIKNTVITIEDFFLRTNDGKVIKVVTDYMTIDLQDLKDYRRGLLIDTRKANFPRGVSEIDVVEIETKIVDVRPAYTNSADGSQCRLRTPKYLNLYTQPDVNYSVPGVQPAPNGIMRMAKDEYLVKLFFSPLNAIQIDIIKEKTQDVECGRTCLFDRERCRPVGRPRNKEFQRCELANSRHPISQLVRKVDES